MYVQIWDHMENKPSERVIQRKADGAFIPFDPGNRDYQEYKRWLDEGNEPAEAEAPPKSKPEAQITLSELAERMIAIENQVHGIERELQAADVIREKPVLKEG